jgi:phosphatidylglycerophosphate synthase
MERVKQTVQTGMRYVAQGLNYASRGSITPNAITVVGFLAHLPIAWLVATRHNLWAAVLLIIFGLFDTLDGQLARLQKRQTATGMLLDSVTDRMKEVLLYTALGYAIIADTGRPYLAIWAIAACGCSLLTSYINAWGDAVMAKLPAATQRTTATPHAANKAFRGGLLPFEIRIVIIILGLLSDRPALAVIVITIGAGYTALSRLLRVYRRLRSMEANAAS